MTDGAEGRSDAARGALEEMTRRCGDWEHARSAVWHSGAAAQERTRFYAAPGTAVAPIRVPGRRGAPALGRRSGGGRIAAQGAPQCRHAGAQQTRAPHGRRRVGVLLRSALLRCAPGHGVALMAQWRAGGLEARALA